MAVPASLGAEAYLLNAGAGIDVVGLRAELLPAAVRAEVLRRHPRGDLAAQFAELSAREAAARPRSRMALLLRLGFADLARRNDQRGRTL